VLETGVKLAPSIKRIKLLVRCKLVFTGIAVNEGCIRVLLNIGHQKNIRMNAIKSNVGNVQMAKLLFGPHVFIVKSVNKTTYSDYNTVHTTDCSKVFVHFHFHKVLNQIRSQ